MPDIFPTGEQGDIALVNSIDPEGYLLDPVPRDVVATLENHSDKRFQELGKFFTKQGRFGHGAEYFGRLARVREAAMVSSTTSEQSIREKFAWEPGEVIDMDELMQSAGMGEELQITDYKGRRYQMVRNPTGFRLIGAYDEKSQPMVGRDGNRLEGKQVVIGVFTTKTDEKLAEFGIKANPHIRLVDPGTRTTQTPNGEEEYTEKRNGKTYQVIASRLRMSFPDGTIGFGMLVSSMILIPKDIQEWQKLVTAQWRLLDSRQDLWQTVKKNQGQNRWLHPNIEITSGNEQFTSFRFDEGGGVSFVVEDRSTDTPQRTEYVFDPNGGNSEKHFVKVGNNWVVSYLDGIEQDGLKKITIQQAARKLDEFRYKLTKTQQPGN